MIFIRVCGNTFQNNGICDSKKAMEILSIKSRTTLLRFEKEGFIKSSRICGTSRKRIKVADLQKKKLKGC